MFFKLSGVSALKASINELLEEAVQLIKHPILGVEKAKILPCKGLMEKRIDLIVNQMLITYSF